MANQVEYVRIKDIYIDQDRLWNVYDRDLEPLRESIEAVGLITPIAVQKRDKGFKLIAGEHRLTVCKNLGLEEIPAHIIERKYDDDEIEDARLEVMEADENIKRKKGDFISEGLLLKRRAKAYNKVLASELGIDLSKQTPEQYKRSLKTTLENMKRNPDQRLSGCSELEKKVNSFKTFKEDVIEKTGLKGDTITAKLRVGTIFEDKEEYLDYWVNKGFSESSIKKIIIGNNIDAVKSAIEIHHQIIQSLNLPKNININTFYQNAMKETKEIVEDKDIQKNDPVAFAKKVEQFVSDGFKHDDYFQLTNSDFKEINVALKSHGANQITIFLGDKVIYQKKA